MTVINTKEFFQQKISEIYPKEISHFRDKENYILSQEYKNLMSLISFKKAFSDSKKENLINDLKIEQNIDFSDFSLFSWNDRAHNIQTLLKTDGLISIILCINISVIIPYYTIYTLKIERKSVNEMRRKHSPITEESYMKEFSELVSKIKLLLEKKYKLKKFPDELLNQITDGFSFQDIEVGSFTFFNAFFLDTYSHTQFI